MSNIFCRFSFVQNKNFTEKQVKNYLFLKKLRTFLFFLVFSFGFSFSLKLINIFLLTDYLLGIHLTQRSSLETIFVPIQIDSQRGGSGIYCDFSYRFIVA
jgi:hypothetical protein